MSAFDLTVLEYIDHPVFVLEPDEYGVPRYIAMSAYARKIIGKTADEIAGKTAAELYGGRLGQIAFDRHCDTLDSGTASEYVVVLPLPEGNRHMQSSLHPICDDTGRVVRIVGCSMDVTGTYVLNDMHMEMATLTREIEETVDLAAHDVHSPSEHVALVADLLLEDFQDLGDGKRELVDLLGNVSEQALKLIGQVLEHTQASSAIEHMTLFDFDALMSTVTTLLDPGRDMSIRYNAAVIEADYAVYQTVLYGLFSAYLKATMPGASRDMQVRLSDPEDGTLQLDVNMSEAIFPSAQRLREAPGLAHVHRLVASRGGAVLWQAPMHVRVVLPGCVVSGAGADTPQVA